MIITIDGPAGSGKSTAARKLARELNYEFLDTGAMYRAIGWFSSTNSLELEADIIDSLKEFNLILDKDKVLINGQDITELIRTTEVTEKASLVALIPEVRACLVQMQRDFAQGENIVSEGRDQGTVVFPDAEFKFYLTASVEKRAERRLKELTDKGEKLELQVIKQQIRERDDRDTSRDSSPLRAADDAILIDTSEMEIPDVVNQLKEIVSE